MINFFNTIIPEEEYICGNKFIQISDTKNIIFSKIDNVAEFKSRVFDTFITHNGDFSVDKHFFENGPTCKRWFAQNKNFNSDKIISIPIGLENFEPEFSYKSQFGKFSSLPINGPIKKDYIEMLSNQENSHKNLVYMNFNNTTFPSERNYVKNFFSKHSWVFKEDNVDWKQYYKSLANSKFCISPRGNGIDCHRTWEALYLRTIPVVKKQAFMEEFSDLPILFINNWDEITEDFLLESYDRMIKKTYNLDKLKNSYWKELIKSKILDE